MSVDKSLTGSVERIVQWHLPRAAVSRTDEGLVVRLVTPDVRILITLGPDPAVWVELCATEVGGSTADGALLDPLAIDLLSREKPEMVQIAHVAVECFYVVRAAAREARLFGVVGRPWLKMSA